jgi:ubiquinone/menaquinone biosynthesis C-methylase UbiE
MGIHEHLFAATYDRFMAKTERELLSELRQNQLTAARGDVLEIGAGTGVNVPAYGGDVRTLTLTEPSAPMIKRLKQRVDGAQLQIPVTVLRAPAEDLPFEDDTFDTVVSTLVLCGAADQKLALHQIRRVLRPGGTLLLIEHVRYDDPELARHQDRMNWLNRFLVGCDCNRPTINSVREAGFTANDLQEMPMPHSPKFIGPVFAGAATAPIVREREAAAKTRPGM